MYDGTATETIRELNIENMGNLSLRTELLTFLLYKKVGNTK
jgi:hypothetical protein